MGSRIKTAHVFGDGRDHVCIIHWSLPTIYRGHRGFSIWPGEAKLDISRFNLRSLIRMATPSPGRPNRGSYANIFVSFWFLLNVVEAKLFVPILMGATGVSMPMTNTPLTTTWKPSQVFIHTGGEDPFCYSELRYDTWIFEEPNRVPHCLAEMSKMSCTFIDYMDIADDFAFTQTARTVKCLGIKHTTHDIKREHGAWRRVWYGNYTDAEGNKMPHLLGMPVVKFRRADRWTYVNAFAVEYCLVFHAKHNLFTGMIDFSGSRTDIPFRYFKVTPTHPMLLKQAIVTSRGFVPYTDGICNEIISIASCLGRICPKTISGATNVAAFWGLGGQPCNKTPSLLEDLKSGHERLMIDDQTTTWWSSIVKSVAFGLSDLFVELVRNIMGQDWQTKVLVKIVVYYATYLLTRNGVIATVVTTAVFVSNFV